MNNDTSARINAPLRVRSLSGFLAMLVALGIIFIGIREFLFPSAAMIGFGVLLVDPGDGALLAIKAARDITSGLVVLTFIALRDRKCLAYAIGVFVLIPLCDGLIVFRHAGWAFDPHMLIHWGTAAYMVVVVELLRMGKLD